MERRTQRDWSRQVAAGSSGQLIPRNQGNIIIETPIQMASHKFSFIVVTPEEYENCQKAEESARAATTASLPVTGAACKPPRKLSVPVSVVSKLKKKLNHCLSAPILQLSTMRRWQFLFLPLDVCQQQLQ